MGLGDVSNQPDFTQIRWNSLGTALNFGWKYHKLSDDLDLNVEIRIERAQSHHQKNA
jgi:hypothetical protein